MTPVSILITIVAYFIILFTVSYIAGRKADNEGFFVGNRKSAWYVVAFAMIGSSISGVTFVSVPGMVAASGFSYLQMVLGFRRMFRLHCSNRYGGCLRPDHNRRIQYPANRHYPCQQSARNLSKGLRTVLYHLMGFLAG